MKRTLVAALSVLVLGVVLACVVHSHSEQARGQTRAKATRLAPAQRGRPPVVGATGVERDDAAGDLVLEGQVVDSNNDPVGGVSVSLNDFPPRIVRSESDGSFSFPHLVARAYLLSATSPSGVAGPITVALQPTRDPVILHLSSPGGVRVTVVDASTGAPIAGATVEARTPVPVMGRTGSDGSVELFPVLHGRWDIVATANGHARAHSGVEISEQPSTAMIALEQGASLRGQVVDVSGAPVSGARVWAVSSTDWTESSSADRDGADAREDGTFELVALKPGTYRVHVRARGFADTASRDITLEGATADAGRIVMNEGGTLRGRVVRRDGTSVPGAEVEVYIKTGLSPRTHAGSDGRFVITDLPRSDVLATARGDGASCWARRVDLSSGAGDVTLTLDLEGSIVGSVVDSTGTPIEGAQVGISLVKSGARLVRSDATDGGGMFRFDGLAEGDYEIDASRPGITTSDRRPQLMAHTGASTVRVVLPATGGLKGQVVFSDGTAPSLVVVRVGANGRSRSFSGGKIAIADIAPGSYDLRIEGPEIASTTASTTDIAEGKTTDVGTIHAERGRVIEGVTVDTNGRPVANAEVVAGNLIVGTGARVDSGGDAPAFQAALKHAVSDADGKFTLRGLPPAALSIVASHPTAGRSTPLTLAADATEPLRVVLAATASLSGNVMSEGKPVGAAVIAQPADAPLALALVIAGEDGAFRYDNLAAGRYSVAATLGDPLAGSPLSPVSATVGPGGHTEVTVQAFQGARHLDVSTVGRGIVFVSTEPLSASTAFDLITQLGHQTQGHWALVNSDGMAHFRYLAPSAYTACMAAIDAPVTNLTAMMHSLTISGATIPVTCRRVPPTASVLTLP